MAGIWRYIVASVPPIPRPRHVPHVLERSDVIVLSLAAALLFAVGSVLQQRAAARRPRQESMKPSLLLRLAARPLWLAANAVSAFAYLLQFLALRRGSLLVVQPLLVTSLLFALPMGAALAHRRLFARDWAAALAVAGGLGLFLVVANPDVGRGEASALGWCSVAVVCGACVVVLAWAARHSKSSRRAAFLGAAAGIVYGLIAVLTKASGTVLERGVLHALASWEPYALVGLAVGGLMLSQSALQAGAFESSLPLLTAGEPVVAAAVGVFAFHEHFGGSAATRGVEGLAIVAVTAGIVWLTRSPLVVDAGAAT